MKKENIKMKQAAILTVLGGAQKEDGKLRALVANEAAYKGYGSDRYSRSVDASIEGKYVVFHDVSPQDAWLVLNRLSHKDALSAGTTTGGGVKSEEIYGTHGWPAGSDPGYSAGDEYPTGKYEKTIFFDEKPAATDDIQFDAGKKTLKINAEKIDAFNQTYRLEEGIVAQDADAHTQSRAAYAFNNLLGVTSDAETASSLLKAFRTAANLNLKDMAPESLDRLKADAASVSASIRTGLVKSGIGEVLDTAELTALVKVQTGKTFRLG